MIELIPAIDIIDGRCVRLTKGDYATERVYSEQPVDMAKAFEDFGFRRLHVVDLDGARSSHIVNHRVVEQIVAQTGLQVDFGGGVKTDEDVQRAFDFGARWVTAGPRSKKGHPHHPLYLRKDSPLDPFDAAAYCNGLRAR